MPVNSDNGGECNRLLGLVKRIDGKRQRLDDARGELGNLYQEVEDIGEHRTALKFALKLRDMEQDKRNDFLHKLSQYCNLLGVWSQGDLFGDEPGLPQAGTDAATPYEEGKRAFSVGVERSACPYQTGGAEAEAWCDGWTDQFAIMREAKNGDVDVGADDKPGLHEFVPPKRRGRPRKIHPPANGGEHPDLPPAA